MLRFWSALVLLALAGCRSAVPPAGPPAERPAPPPAAALVLPGDFAYPPHDSFRVVTWNVEHWVDAHDDPYIDNARENAAQGPGERLEPFLAAVRALDADVLVLQEFESARYLRALADSLLPDMGYRFFAGTPSLTWYQNVVVASRLPLGVLRSYAAAPTPIEGETDDAGRPASQSLVNHRLWTVDVLARPDYAFALVGAHLKAGRGPSNEGWRRGQIRLLHTDLARLRALHPDLDVLIAGDLNATPESGEIALLLNADGAAGPVAFVNPSADRQHLTHPAPDPTRQLDYLLPSRSMLPRLVPGSVQVAAPLPLDAMARVADHLPVVADFVAPARR
jgi:endonuclease/exonuclease/phosphatase family metal-dependent hydrolase